jgi:hypothetical protein
MEKPAELPSGDREAWDHIATQAIRGPLAWIISQLDAIDSDLNSQVSPASKKALTNARGASKRLLDMLESLLASQRITSGLEPASPQPISLTSALEPVIKQLTVRAHSEGKSYQFNAEGLGLAAAANEDLLRRAVRLVSNRGLDEAQKGGQVRATASSMSGGLIRLRIIASPPAEDSGQVGQVVPAEIGFARMAVEQMGGKFSSARTAEQGMMVDIVLPTPGAVAARPAAPAATVTAPAEPVREPVAAVAPPPPVEPVRQAPILPPPPPAQAAAAAEESSLPDIFTEPPKMAEPAKPPPPPEEEPPPSSPGFKITREVTFDWGPDK